MPVSRLVWGSCCDHVKGSSSTWPPLREAHSVPGKGRCYRRYLSCRFCCSRRGFREFSRIHKIQENKHIKWKTWKKGERKKAEEGGRDELRSVPPHCPGCSLNWLAPGFPGRFGSFSGEGSLLCEIPHSNHEVKNMFFLRRSVIIPRVKIAIFSQGCS